LRKRRRISRRDLQYLLAFAATATLVTSSVAYGTLNPPPSERFFAMWILGSGGLVEHYYPEDDPNLGVGDEVNWTLGVYNHMGSVQYVVVRAKLLNSTLASPDELTGKPSPVIPLFEFTRVLLDNETWSIPFVWRVLNVTISEGRLMLTELSINGVHLNGEFATAFSGFNYRFVFELWSFDQAFNDLTFTWRTNSSQHSAWTQIWFNMTVSAPL